MRSLRPTHPTWLRRARTVPGSRPRRRRAPALMLGGLALAASACAPEFATSVVTPGSGEVTITADDLFFEPDTLVLPAGEPVAIALENVGGLPHDLVLDDGWSSGEVRPGQTVAAELPALEATTVAWCSVPGHRDAGMELELVVEAP